MTGRLRITYGNTATTAYAQNARLWPSSFVTNRGGVITSAAYSYDGTGNLSTIADSADSSFNRTLGYDGIGRLTSASGPWGSGTIGYDGVGNITSSAYGASTLTYAYDSSNRLASLSGARTASYNYGNYGTIVSDGAAGNVDTNTYQYDGVPNLTCVNCAEFEFTPTRRTVERRMTTPQGTVSSDATRKSPS
jgi:hypothetical protein